MVTPEDVLTFWFAGALSSAEAYGKRMPFWFTASSAVDDEVRRRFTADVEAAGAGELSDWRNEGRSLLALIILLDQFPRNIHRGTADAFRYDSRALASCLRGIARARDMELRVGERIFFYMPLQHAEDLATQNQSVAITERLLAGCEPDFAPIVARCLDYARQHRGIIETFGRFPHRNAVLHRDSTAAELAYLEQADRFGQ